MKRRLILGLVLLAAIAVGFYSRGQSWAQSEDTRVITIHIEGQSRSVATNAKTVQEALARADVQLDSKDKTEPSLDQQIEGNDYTINVYRARPISVVDGPNIYSVLTAQRSGRAIAQEAGFTTDQEDQFEFEKTDNNETASPSTRMVIKRSKNITFGLYGTSAPLRTHENTVGALLQERNLKLEKGDEVNVPLATKITEGMTVSVDRVDRNSETVEEVANFSEEQIRDAQQPISFRQIKTPGKNGKKLVTYEIVTRNDGAPERRVIKEVITEKPTSQVVVIGAKAALNVPGNCGAWLAEAGITNSDAVWLISKESGCNPGAVNRSSGACGIPQAYPCSKLPCPLDGSGAVCQLNWMNRYVLGRYGSWEAARAFHASRGWY